MSDYVNFFNFNNFNNYNLTSLKQMIICGNENATKYFYRLVNALPHTFVSLGPVVPSSDKLSGNLSNS